MKGSILVYGGKKQHRLQQINSLIIDLGLEQNENQPDILVVDRISDKKSIGIDQIRQIKKFVAEKPLSSSNKAVIVLNAELLTHAAQNALLKTLEEPPEYLSIYLSAKTQDILLDTIVSRCKRIKVNFEVDEITTKNAEAVMEVINKTLGERLTLVDSIAKQEKEEILELLQEWVLQLRGVPTLNSVSNINLILRVSKDLDTTNINTKLALETLVLTLKTP